MSCANAIRKLTFPLKIKIFSGFVRFLTFLGTYLREFGCWRLVLRVFCEGYRRSFLSKWHKYLQNGKLSPFFMQIKNLTKL